MRNTPTDVADFIRTLTLELTDMARSADLQALGFILTLASLEAKQARQTSRRAPAARGRHSGRATPAAGGSRPGGRPGRRGGRCADR